MNSHPRVFMIGPLLPGVAALLVFFSICELYAASAQEQPAHEWGHSGGGEGPAHWGELTSEFAVYKTGHHQSPVNIVDAQC
jgi:carbonic anhydrase